MLEVHHRKGIPGAAAEDGGALFSPGGVHFMGGVVNSRPQRQTEREKRREGGGSRKGRERERER